MFIYWLIHSVNINQRWFFFPVNYNEYRDLLMHMGVLRVSSSLNMTFTPSLKSSRTMRMKGYNNSKSKNVVIVTVKYLLNYSEPLQSQTTSTDQHLQMSAHSRSRMAHQHPATNGVNSRETVALISELFHQIDSE